MSIFGTSVMETAMQNKPPSQAQKRPKRSFLLILLIIIYLAIAYFGWLRFSHVLSGWKFYSQYPLANLLPYLAVSGFAWGALNLSSGVVLWFGWRWAPFLAGITAIISVIWYWLDRLLLTVPADARANQVFAVILSLLLVLFAFIVLALPAQRRFFLRS
jgi:uncharacterized membrane protein YidH (DUF202 family)